MAALAPALPSRRSGSTAIDGRAACSAAGSSDGVSLASPGEVYYWPPGHTVRVDEDYEAVEFSPSGPMREVIDHLESRLSA
jgi:hypothetical protein